MRNIRLELTTLRLCVKCRASQVPCIVIFKSISDISKIWSTWSSVFIAYYFSWLLIYVVLCPCVTAYL